MNEENNDQIFIAYQGEELDITAIKEALTKKMPEGHQVKILQENNVTMAKILPKKDGNCSWDKKSFVRTLNGYDKKEIDSVIKNFGYDTSFQYIDKDADFMHSVFMNWKETCLVKVRNYTKNWCTVVYQVPENRLFASVLEPTIEEAKLFYGYTPKNNEIFFSNDKKIVQQFCKNIFQMQNNTIMKNGKISTLDQTCVEEYGMSLREIDEANEENRYSSLPSPNLDEEEQKSDSNYSIKKQVLENIKDIIQNFNFEDEITPKITKIIDDKVEEQISNSSLPTTYIIKLNDNVISQTKDEFYHEKFETILKQVQLDEPIMLVGPAGSGKNVAVSQVAKALNLHMYYTNNASNEFKLTGFIDAGGNYRDTEFYKAFKNGGVFFLDEIDNSDPSALIVLNSALANGYMAFPHETIDKHPNFRIIAAANTWGKGADLQYVGRNALDAATLDRFANIFFDYDPKLEKALYPNNTVLQFMWSFRNAIYQSKISHIVSTRGIGKVYKKDINNFPINDTLTSNVIKNLKQDDINIIIGKMTGISDENKYYEGLKKLKLGR